MPEFLGLMTRCKDDVHIGEFVNYYLSEGVNEIHIIDDDSADKSIYHGLDSLPQVKIIWSKDILVNDDVERLYREIRFAYEWLIFVDIDEFLVPKRQSNLTLRDLLLTRFEEVDCIKVPWVMMSWNGEEHVPEYLLTSRTWRWDHDQRHPNPINKFRCRYEKIEVKCIFRPKYFAGIWDHHPTNPTTADVRVVDSVDGRAAPLDSFHDNLHEKEIERAELVCMHYRVTSVEDAQRKLDGSLWYTQAGFTLDDLKSSDHAERRDLTLRKRVLDRDASEFYGKSRSWWNSVTSFFRRDSG